MVVEHTINSEEEKIWHLLEDVHDPEVPVLTVLDLGVVRNVRIEGGKVFITITPTYSGCPAMSTIEMDIRFKLLAEGYKEIIINTVLTPSWTTDWLTESGKKKAGRIWYRSSRSAAQQHKRIVCKRCDSSLSFMQIRTHKAYKPVRLYRVQIFVSMPRLQGAV